jgi:multisubunit Na+/H+ antiporter MnhE subunit
MSPGGDGPRGGGGRRGEVRAWLAWWAILTALYVVLVDSRRLEELVAAVVVGALGATASVLVRRGREVVLRPRPADVAAELRTLLSWPRDVALLAMALVRRPPGEVVETPFEATSDDPRDAARRALAVAGRSLAPNTIVIGIDEERGVLVSHQLVDSKEER